MALGRWLAISYYYLQRAGILWIATAAILPGPFFFILVKRNDDVIHKGSGAPILL